MKTTKTKKAYILYKRNEFLNDFEQVFEYYSIKDLLKDNDEIKLENERSIYQFISKSLDDINHLLNDKYLIIEEALQYERY